MGPIYSLQVFGVTFVSLLSASGCDGLSSEYNGYCYYESQLTWNGWFDARKECRYKGAELVSIGGPGENSFLATLIADIGVTRAWIGLNSLYNGRYRWTDESALAYVNFPTGELSTSYGDKRCVSIDKSGLWKITDCDKSLLFLCKKKSGDSTPSVVTTTFSKGGCPGRFTSIPGASHCYRLQGHGDGVPFSEAGRACKSLQPGGTLASIHSRLDQKFVTTLLGHNSDHAWIGLTDPNGQSGGLQYAWVDKTHTDYTPWKMDQPEGFSQGKTCVLMDSVPSTAGQWLNGDCASKKDYICEVAKDPNLPEQGLQADCGNGFIKYRNSCYRFVTDSKNWTAAYEACQVYDFDAGLVNINDQLETAFIDILIHNASDAWIGMYYRNDTQSYSWGSGYPVYFTDWSRGEVYESSDMCVTDSFGDGWKSLPCSTRRPFVCEINYASGMGHEGPVLSHGVCPKGWISYGYYCYHLPVEMSKNWHAASSYCRGESASLVSIHNIAETRFIAKLLTLHRIDVWTGLNSVSGFFSWSDESEMEFLNWNTSQPTTTKKHSCVIATHRSGGQWSNTRCYGEKHFICKMRQLSKLPQLPATTDRTPITNPKLHTHSLPTSTSKTATSSTTASKNIALETESKNSGLGAGATAGVTILSLACVAMVGVAALTSWKYYGLRKKTNALLTKASFDNVNYDDSNV